MDFPASTPSETPSRRRPAVLAVIALFAAVYAWVIIKDVGACAGGSDSSGYLNHAQLLAKGVSHVPPRVIPGLPPGALPSYAYVPLGFRPDAVSGDLVPTYSPGLSLFVVAAQAFVGWYYAGDVVLVIHCFLGIAVMYALCRAFSLAPTWSLIGTLILATSPVYLFMSLQAMSDVPSLVWEAIAVLAAWKARERASWAWLAGAAVAVSVLLRPTNIMIMLPVAICLGLSPRRWLYLCLAGVPGAVFTVIHNKALYGGAFTTGYGAIWTAFSPEYVPDTLRAYAQWIPALFTPVAVLVVALPFLSAGHGRRAAVLVSWAILCPAFYVSYYCTHETWWYERFNLPSVPAMVLGGLLVLQALGRRWLKRPSALVAWAAAVLILANSFVWSYHFDALSIGRGERNYRHLSDWLMKNLPPESILGVMQASGAVYYYTPFALVRWDNLMEGGYAKVAKAAQAAHRPLYAVLFPFEKDQALTERMPGAWTRVGAYRDITIWRCDHAVPNPKF